MVITKHFTWLFDGRSPTPDRMAYNYNALYGETRNALGTPTPIFVHFFDQLDRHDLRVLDVGCGQGRDAIFIAKRGHHVVGVDIAANGIRDIRAVAADEHLSIEGVIADIANYTPEGAFDVVVLDRTLHMLKRPVRRAILKKMLDHVAPNGWILIADEPANIKDFEGVIRAHGAHWTPKLIRPGALFLHRP